MRRLFLPLIAIAVAMSVTAQNTPKKMNIKLVNSSEVVSYNISDIEAIWKLCYASSGADLRRENYQRTQ